jgi:hypothetical protein
VDEAEAERTYQALKELDQLSELESPFVEDFQDSDTAVLIPPAKGSSGNEIP